MKSLFTIAFLLCFSTSFSQWTRVEQLPPSDIPTVYHNGNTIYAGGKARIYFSTNRGQTWDSTSQIPQFSFVDNIIFYKNELYASSHGIGVSKSPDGGASWQNISAGLFPHVSDFFEWRGDLYASTLGSSVYKLEPVARNSWFSFSNGLSNLSANLNTLSGNDNAMVAGTFANALYDYLPANTTNWQERFLLNILRPTEGAYDIINSHDSLFLAGRTGRFYKSTDNGLNWTTFGNILPSLNTTLSNAKQALLASRSIFDGANFHTAFYYIKKDSLQFPLVNFSFVQVHLTYKADIAGNRFWDASDKGLFYMELSDLGLSDSTPVILPVQFTAFNAACNGNNIKLTWKTGQEQNSRRFDIERSPDGRNWTVIGNVITAGNSNEETVYSFIDDDRLPNAFYRIAEHDQDGRIQYSGILRQSCAGTDLFSVYPNPVHDKVYINLVAENAPRAIISIYDGRGALVKQQTATLLTGNNQVSIDMSSLLNGVYLLSAEWENGLMKTTRTVKLLKR
jgi:hypothetical protein